MERQFENHSQFVYNYLRLRLGPDDAEDATVETFRRAHRGLSTFRWQSSERTWLMTIARNVANRTEEQKKKRREVQMPDTEFELDQAIGSTLADDSAVDKYFVRQALATLPDQQREAVWLRVALEFTDEETAAILRVPVGTVKSWVWRALVRLRNWAEVPPPDATQILGEAR
ncbi:MAG: ECF RNA polymerase sigma factor EcfG [Fimbriimonadaceae bacterium]|nr:ECF RNA polymerase sigma factor EcfG [Fimbriimonadaceae bacterium]